MEKRSHLPAMAALGTVLLLLASGLTAPVTAKYQSLDIRGPVVATEVEGTIYGALENYTFPITPQNENVVLAIRFREVNIPRNAFLTTCRLFFTSVPDAQTQPSEVIISVLEERASGAITSETFDISQRPVRSGATTWSIPPWRQKATRTSPQLVSHLMPYLQRQEWNAGDPLFFTLRSAGATSTPTPRIIATSGGSRPYLRLDYVVMGSSGAGSDQAHDLVQVITSQSGLAVIIILYGYAMLAFVAVSFSYATRKKPLPKMKTLYHQPSHLKIFGDNIESPNHPLHEWEMPPSALLINKEVGRGRFGRVYQATARNIEGLGTVEAAVKICGASDGTDDYNLFFEAAFTMHTFGAIEHNNVLRMYGVVSASRPHMIVTEFCANGSLHETLMASKRPDLLGDKKRKKRKNQMSSLLLSDRVKLAADIACGMAFLSNQGFVHRNIAACNCLVDENFVAKVAGFHSAHVLNSRVSDIKGDIEFYPVRWLSPQALAHGQFTSKSDIWSFGILLWECASLGDTPYRAAPDNQTALELILQGKQPRRPTNCPDSLYTLMRLCWRMSPQTRPDFEDILSAIYDLHQSYQQTEKKYHKNHGTLSRIPGPAAPNKQTMRRDQSFRSRTSTMLSNIINKVATLGRGKKSRPALDIPPPPPESLHRDVERASQVSRVRSVSDVEDLIETRMRQQSQRNALHGVSKQPSVRIQGATVGATTTEFQNTLKSSSELFLLNNDQQADYEVADATHPDIDEHGNMQNELLQNSDKELASAIDGAVGNQRAFQSTGVHESQRALQDDEDDDGYLMDAMLPQDQPEEANTVASSQMSGFELYLRDDATGTFVRASEADASDPNNLLYQKFIVPDGFQPRATHNEFWDPADHTFMFAPAPM